MNEILNCTLCPRGCGADRSERAGVCGARDYLSVAKTMLHRWEEPCISGKNGSGAIFFSGCPLKCVYCQNKDISHTLNGEKMSVDALSDAMLSLQERGAHNINLVSPTQFSPFIREALDKIRGALKIPVVYNTGGYEKPSEIEKMSSYVDIFLTDIKYFSPELARKYSLAPDYFKWALASLEKMLEIVPKCDFDNDGMMKRGVVLRHLVLPSHREDSIKILERVAERVDISAIKLSLMSQYTPDFYDGEDKALRRRITTFEYQSVVDRAIELGYDGYIQEKTSASKEYTPSFKGEQNEN